MPLLLKIARENKQLEYIFFTFYIKKYLYIKRSLEEKNIYCVPKINYYLI